MRNVFIILKKTIEGYTEKQNGPDPVPSFPCHDPDHGTRHYPE